MSSIDESVTQLMEIAGVDEVKAVSLLQMSDFNLERALNFHLENEAFESPSNSNSSSNQELPPLQPHAPQTNKNTNTSLDPTPGGSVYIDDDEDDVRAPIPAREEQLLNADEDQFRINYDNEPRHSARLSRKRRLPPNGKFTFCPFRDFAKEAQIQEELSEEFNDIDSQSTSRKAGSKRKRLEDLFRPPIDLLFWGTFQAAKEYSAGLNKFLIVNVQDQKEFRCQVLNRDIWSDKNLKTLISSNFILWQVSIENPDGLRFKTFYHVEECPYVCVIDPRTGEKRLTCDTSSAKILLNNLMEFLAENDFCLDTSLKAAMESNGETSSSSCAKQVSAANNEKSNEKGNILDLSEEEQIRLAILNSVKEAQNDEGEGSSNNVAVANSDCFSSVSEESNDFPEIEDSESSKAIAENPELTTKIQIRLPDGEKEELKLSSSTSIKYLKSTIRVKYPDITKNTYKLITSSFPRTNILELDETLSLLDAKLHPASIIYLHPDE